MIDVTCYAMECRAHPAHGNPEATCGECMATASHYVYVNDQGVICDGESINGECGDYAPCDNCDKCNARWRSMREAEKKGQRTLDT